MASNSDKLSIAITGSATRNLDLAVTFTVAPSQRVAIIGHNGSGKTSVLRLIAGLDYARSGTQIRVGETLLTADSLHLPVPDRLTPMTFAEPRLFPHMSVLKNLTFGSAKGRRASLKLQEQALDALAKLGMSHLANRPSGELSSGQSATIAVLRTVFAPSRTVLLDEPFSALDTAIASEVRATVRAYLESLSVPLLIATHNPLDVMSLATHVAVLEHGKLTQFGSVTEVARQPRTEFAAQFLGLNLVRGTAAAGGMIQLGTQTQPPLTLSAAHLGDTPLPAGAPAFVAFSPASVTLSILKPHGSAQNTWRAPVALVEQMGSIVRVVMGGPVPIRVDITAAAALSMQLRTGQSLWVSIKATAIEVYPA